MSKPPAAAGIMLNKKSLILRGALYSTALFNKSILLSNWVLSARVMAGSLQVVSRSAEDHAVPEEKWMTLHPLLPIAADRANLPAAARPAPLHRHVPPELVAAWRELCQLREKLVQVSSANCSSKS